MECANVASGTQAESVTMMSVHMCNKNNLSAAECGRLAATWTLEMEKGGGRQTGDRMLKIMLKAPRLSGIFDWLESLALALVTQVLVLAKNGNTFTAYLGQYARTQCPLDPRLPLQEIRSQLRLDLQNSKRCLYPCRVLLRYKPNYVKTVATV